MSVEAIIERQGMPVSDLFDRWAEVYDSQENPFFSLEQQVLEDVLPNLSGSSVLDAGCGTGRLFQYFKDCGAQRIVGVDSSIAMVRHAEERGIAEVVSGSCDAMPTSNEEFDVAIASFVLSYIANPEAAAAELMRVCRPGAVLIVSDMHPETAHKLGWKRTFRYENEALALPWFRRSLVEIVKSFESVGWQLEISEERPFTAHEKPTFERVGRGKYLEEIQKHPALFVLRFRKQSKETLHIGFTGARCAVSARDAFRHDIAVTDGKFVNPSADLTVEHSVSLQNMLILPGLINAHDHLEFALYPRMGYGPYQNATAWAADIQQNCVQEITQQKLVPRDARVLWGALRNLLCGVTTVCHHNPLLPVMLTKDFPVRVVRNMRWAHSLAVEQDVREQALEGDPQTPFIVHAAEGIDASASEEFDQLQSMGLIGPQTVLVHGLALSADQARRLSHAGASVILCPSSNQYLFNRFPSMEFLNYLQHSALGSDSPLTAEGDLLDEVRFAKSMVGVGAEQLYQMVTEASAKVLGLHNGEGFVAENGVADMIAVEDLGLGPAEALSKLSWRDVELVVRRGRIFLASGRTFQRLPNALREGLEQLWIEGEERWVRAPLAKMFEQASPVMFDGALSLAGREVRHGLA
jgi:cytosine/adenosine deaminase-related metal-dependent hydrolase/ubiquinone/menaquinone biosynthesis C-methylase UbiE